MTEKNQYQADIDSDNDLYRLRAYAHDVIKSSDDPISDTYVEDVNDLLSLIDGILRSNGINPDEYSETLGRGGYIEEDDDDDEEKN